MSITIEPSHPEFVAEIAGIDLAQPLGAADRDAIEAAIDRYVVGGGAGFGRVSERPDAMIERDLADGLLTRDPRSARKLAAE